MTAYSLTVNNTSGEAWDIFTFQKNPNLNDPKIKSLAWFTKYAAANSKVTFTWNLVYNFLWAQTGQLTNGVVFKASQSFPADPYGAGLSTHNSAGNQARLTYNSQDDYFEFGSGPALTGTAPGTLYVKCDGSVPNDVASVGIGMSGAGTFAQPALTNITALFTPEPTYYVAATKSIQQGEVLEEEVSQAVMLQYTGVTSLTATFLPDHTWTVSNA